jgi:hypothetical protein
MDISSQKVSFNQIQRERSENIEKSEEGNKKCISETRQRDKYFCSHFSKRS